MKKKNLFGWLAMATMLVGTGCSTDEVVNDYSPENAIQFGTYVGRDAGSRASVFDESVMGGATGKGFGVFAYHTSGNYSTDVAFNANFMNNQKVTSVLQGNDYVWSYDPVKYWPNNSADRVSFIAYAPYVENKTFNQNQPGMIDFTVTNDVKSQTDLVWANALNKSKQAINDSVKFQFAHALSRIGFNISLAVDATTKEEGDLDQNTTIYVDKIELSSAFYESGILDLRQTTTTSWYPSGSQGFVLDYVYDTTITPAATNNNTTELQNNIFDGAIEDIETEKQLNKDDSYIMIIPKSNTVFTLTVTYRVFTKDEALTNTVPEQGNEVKGSLVTNVIPIELTQDFEAGKAYTYNIILGMTSVKVNTNVTPWDEQEAKDVEATENTENQGTNS